MLDWNGPITEVLNLSALLQGIAPAEVGNYVQIVEKGVGAVDELQIRSDPAQSFQTVAILNADAGVKILYNDDHRDAVIPHP